MGGELNKTINSKMHTVQHTLCVLQFCVICLKIKLKLNNVIFNSY